MIEFLNMFVLLYFVTLTGVYIAHFVSAVFGVLRGSALPMVVVGALVLIGYVAVLAALRELRAADLRVPMEILRNQRLLPIRTRSGAG